LIVCFHYQDVHVYKVQCLKYRYQSGLSDSNVSPNPQCPMHDAGGIVEVIFS